MLSLQRLALELLEYKVKDLKARRKLPGGGSSAWELYDHLVEEIATLSAEERRRFESASIDLKRYGEVNSRKQQTVADFEKLTLDGVAAPAGPSRPAGLVLDMASTQAPRAPQTPAELEEQRTLQRLARKVWWADVERVVQRLAASSRAEKDRVTVRLIYAVLRNLSHHARSTNFADDLELRQFVVKEPVSELSDPLASFNDIENIKELYLNFVETILTLTQPESPNRVNMPAQRSFGYIRKMALLVAQDPYAGQFASFKSKTASSKQIRMAMDELGKERMREEQRQVQRRKLEARLKEALAHEKSQRQLFERDVLRYQEALDAFFNQLRVHLLKRVGGEADEPQLAGGVLFAENPALRLDEIPPDSKTVTVQLKGPLRFQLGDVSLALMGSGDALVLYVNERQHQVTPAMDLEVGPQRLKVFQEGNYLHFRLSDGTRSLATLAAEALVAGKVLRSPHREAFLSVLKTATGVAAQQAQEVVRLALERLRQLTAKAPDARSALKGFIEGGVRAVRVDLPGEAVEDLADSLHRTLSVQPNDLESVLDRLESAKNVKKAMFELGDDPISLTLAGVPLTIRQYRGRGGDLSDNVVVMMPGRPLGSFTDYLLEPFEGGLLVCVRSDDELLVIFFSGDDETATVA